MATRPLPDLPCDDSALQPEPSGEILELDQCEHRAAYVRGADDEPLSGRLIAEQVHDDHGNDGARDTVAVGAGDRAVDARAMTAGEVAAANPTRHHGHLWVLLDGTPAHAPVGRLTVDRDGRLACHLCGRWFEHLGLHVRRHGWDVDRYRAAVGLSLNRPLCSTTISARIAERQQRRWCTQPAFREAFAPGQRAARSGELGALAAGRVRARRTTEGDRLEVTRSTRQSLDRGRDTVEARRRSRRETVVAAAGHPNLSAFLRAEYAAGASLAALAAMTGLGRARLRREMDAAGIARRAPGMNRSANKRARAATNDSAAAARLGVDDVRAWLRLQRARGVTVTDLALEVGRSEPWIRARIVS